MPDELWDSQAGELLRAALSAEPGAGADVVTAGESGARAAFRAARDSGLHAAPAVREADDWTPVVGTRRASRRPLKALVVTLAASVTLGGVAVAAGGLPGNLLGTPAPSSEPQPTRSLPHPASAPADAGGKDAATRSAPPGTPAPLRPEKDPPELPGRGQDGLCRALEKGGWDSGKASKSAAWQRLVAAAGGEELVPEYCRNHSLPAPAPSAASRPNEGGGRGTPAANSGRRPERPRTEKP
ncbi:hypothetical protein ACF07V_25295 [Streptomyces sp. NPDC015661]|uniref:hypothetical protein n=1 Tax=Streptomyces sp. NPDC015661 TaxID=3364961 RepID=UPI0036F68C59